MIIEWAEIDKAEWSGFGETRYVVYAVDDRWAAEYRGPEGKWRLLGIFNTAESAKRACELRLAK